MPIHTTGTICVESSFAWLLSILGATTTAWQRPSLQRRSAVSVQFIFYFRPPWPIIIEHVLRRHHPPDASKPTIICTDPYTAPSSPPFHNSPLTAPSPIVQISSYQSIKSPSARCLRTFCPLSSLFDATAGPSFSSFPQYPHRPSPNLLPSVLLYRRKLQIEIIIGGY